MHRKTVHRPTITGGGVFAVTTGLHDKYGPTRVFDTPISELAMTGAAFGAAVSGMRPVLEIMFGDFLGLSMDSLINQASKYWFLTGGRQSVPLVIRTPIVSRIGMGPQHSQSLEAWFMHIPGLKIAIPSNAFDAKGLMRAALRDPNPVVFIENVKLYGSKAEVPEAEYAIPFGKSRILAEGSDATIVAISGTVPAAGPPTHSVSRPARRLRREPLLATVAATGKPPSL